MKFFNYGKYSAFVDVLIDDILQNSQIEITDDRQKWSIDLYMDTADLMGLDDIINFSDKHQLVIY